MNPFRPARPLLEVRNLAVRYETDAETVHALNGVSFAIGRGETLGLVGETGAGKTTAALAIMRQLPAPPGKLVGGEILLDGASLLQKNEREMRRLRGDRLAMIFADPMTALNPVATAGGQVAEVLRLHRKLSRAQAAGRATQMLGQVGIPADRYGDYPHQLSGGMRQRVCIAMSLVCNPALLIADEPTTALDVTIQAQVLALMKDLKAQYGTSMLLITHDLGVVAEVCDKAAILYAGEIVEYGDLAAIFEDARHPYTRGLFRSLPRLTGDIGRLEAIPGIPPDPTALPEGCKFRPRCPQSTAACARGEIPNMEAAAGHWVKCVSPLKC